MGAKIPRGKREISNVNKNSACSSAVTFMDGVQSGDGAQGAVAGACCCSADTHSGSTEGADEHSLQHNSNLVNQMSSGMQWEAGPPLSPVTPSSNLKRPVVFRWGKKDAKVFVSGSYDSWKSRTRLIRNDSHLYTVIDVPLGKHEYKYIVDGTWTVDPNEVVVDDESGSRNNQLVTKASDYNVMRALLADDHECDRGVPSMWSQHIPINVVSATGYLRRGPPSVPPYLDMALLNHPVSSQAESSMLVEPNRVIINHLYTLSMKEGVVVMCATMRYRKKYITMVLYKPT